MPALSVAAPSALRVPIEAAAPAHQVGLLNKIGQATGTLASLTAVVNANQGIAAGSLAVWVVSWASASDIVTGAAITDSVGGNTWTVDAVGAGVNPGIAVISSVLVNALPPSATITVTWTSGTPGGRMYMILDYGPGFGAHDVVAGSFAAGSGAANQALTPTAAGDVILHAVGFSGTPEGDTPIDYKSPLVSYGTQKHTGSANNYMAAADTLLGADLSTFTATAFGGTKCGWATVAYKATTATNQTVLPPVATATASSPVPGVAVSIPAAVATASASFPVPTVAADSPVNPPAATATASFPIPGIALNIPPPAATASASFPVPTVLVTNLVAPPAATATASSPVPGIAVNVPAPVATATASFPVPTVAAATKVLPPVGAATASSPIPGLAVKVPIPAATAAASMPVPTVTAGTANQNVAPPVATASASFPIPTVVSSSGPGPIIITSLNDGDLDFHFVPRFY